MNSGITSRTLTIYTYDMTEVKVYYDRSDCHLPIELEVGGKYTWLTGEQALDLAEFLVTAIEKINSKEKTNDSELQET